MTGWWKCCNESCKREVNPKLFNTTCPDCRHEKCVNCKDLSNSSAPDPQPAFAPAPGQQHMMHYDSLSQQHHQHGAPNVGNHFYPNDSYHNSNPYNSRDPSFSGWWMCCQCQYEVNPHTSGWECPVDGHRFCYDHGGHCYIIA